MAVVESTMLKEGEGGVVSTTLEEGGMPAYSLYNEMVVMLMLECDR